MRVAVGFTLLIGLVGIGTGWFAGRALPDGNAALKRDRTETVADKPGELTANQVPARSTAASLAAIPAQRPDEREIQPAVPQRSLTAPPPVRQPVTAESVYHCGAETRKGTPCSRRVKEPEARCYQHAGMPAMAALDPKTATKRR